MRQPTKRQSLARTWRACSHWQTPRYLGLAFRSHRSQEVVQWYTGTPMRARAEATFVTRINVRASHFTDSASDIDGVCRLCGSGEKETSRSPSCKVHVLARCLSHGGRWDLQVLPKFYVVGCSISSSLGGRGLRCSTHVFKFPPYARRQFTWRRSSSVEY